MIKIWLQSLLHGKVLTHTRSLNWTARPVSALSSGANNGCGTLLELTLLRFPSFFIFVSRWDLCSFSISLSPLSFPSLGRLFPFLSKIQTWMEWFWFLCTAKAQMYQSGQLDLESVVKTQAAGWHCEMGVWQWPWRPWLQFCAKPLWNLVGNTRNTNNFDLFSARRSDVLVALYPMRSHEVFSKNY